MSNLIRLLVWPAGFLPRRSVAPAQSVGAADAGELPRPAAVEPPTSLPADATAGDAGAAVALGERRAAALRTLFPMLFSMVARRSDLWQAITIERYLSQATDIVDLERRIREVERRRPFHESERTLNVRADVAARGRPISGTEI